MKCLSRKLIHQNSEKTLVIVNGISKCAVNFGKVTNRIAVIQSALKCCRNRNCQNALMQQAAYYWCGCQVQCSVKVLN